MFRKPFPCAALRALAVAALISQAALAQTVRGREARPVPAGEVVVTINEQTFNALIEALFTLPQPPTFPLGGGARGGECPGEISLAREIAGARTSVRFRDGHITAPVAFRGSYAALQLMENRPSQISVLPVVDSEGRCVGLLRLHDIIRSGL